MAITPINIARVSSSLQTLSLLSSLRSNTLNLFLQQNRLASGNRFNAPSEDPVGAAKAVQLSQMLERQEQILANIRHADGVLAATDVGIQDVNDLLIEAHAIALEMVNSHADQDQRESQAELIRAMINQMVTIGNRQYKGIYLFGGQQTLRAPFTQTFGGVEYVGDTNWLTTSVDERLDPKINLDGSELFGALTGTFHGYADLDPILDENTRLADLHGTAGTGVQKSYIRIALDSPESSFTVDLRSADTVGDVVDLINAAAEQAGLNVGPGGDFFAGINADANGIDISSASGNLTIKDVGKTRTARDLGILGTGTSAIQGADLNPKVTTRTTLDTLFGGTGATLNSIELRNGERTEIIDLSDAETIGDVLNAINATDLQIRAEINADADGINIVNISSGTRMSVGEAGSDTAELLGIRTMHGGTLLSSLNDGKGVDIKPGVDDFRIIAKDGSTIDVNLDGATTIQDVLDAINAAAAAAGVAVSASLPATGTGIVISDATGGAGTLAVERLNFSTAIDGLGLNKSADDPAATELRSDDVSAVRVDSVFTALIDLFNALKAGDEQAITGAGERLHDFIDHTNRLQGVIGARSRAMTTRLELTEDAVVASTALLSEIKDLDYTEAVTQFQQAQTALQANLLTGSRIMQLSLLDFI